MSVSNNDPDLERGASFYDAPRSRRQPADHSEVAAALARFQEKLARASYFERPKVRVVWAACAFLTFAAFAGGLSLARFSFNTPEHPISVLTRAPELIYFPPQSPAAALADLQSSARSTSTPVLALAGAEARRRAEPSIESSDAPARPTVRSAPVDVDVSEGGDLNLVELGRSWTEAVRLADTMQQSRTSQNSEPLQQGYAAVEVSAIPEASTGLAVALAVASILAWGHTSKARRRVLSTANEHAV